MAVCHYCSVTVLFGGVTEGGKLFCNDRCRQSAALLALAERAPYKQVQRKIAEFHQGRCPKCGGPGPVDVHYAYRVCSGLFKTDWSNTPHLCCRWCGTKAQLGALGYSLLLGWWGLPWGLILTPLQVVWNLKALFAGPRPLTPSKDLEKLVRVGLAARLAHGEQTKGTPASAPP